MMIAIAWYRMSLVRFHLLTHCWDQISSKWDTLNLVVYDWWPRYIQIENYVHAILFINNWQSMTFICSEILIVHDVNCEMWAVSCAQWAVNCEMLCHVFLCAVQAHQNFNLHYSVLIIELSHEGHIKICCLW